MLFVDAAEVITVSKRYYLLLVVNVALSMEAQIMQGVLGIFLLLKEYFSGILIWGTSRNSYSSLQVSVEIVTR